MGVTEGEDPAVGRHQPIAATIGRRRDPDDWIVEMSTGHGTQKWRSAEREDSPSRAVNVIPWDVAAATVICSMND